MTFQRAAAFAPINIALVKYWGKRDDTLNLPLASSIAVTLAELGSLTVVAPEESLEANIIAVNDKPISGPGLLRVARVMRAIRERAGNTEVRAGIRSVNTVPTAQGLASSSSAFASLARAAATAYGVDIEDRELSAIARLGSGSASRSIHGGFVAWTRGVKDDGSDSAGELIQPPEYWPLRALVCHVDVGHKKISSTDGMKFSRDSCAYFDAWIQRCRKDFEHCRVAIADKDFNLLADVVESNCLAMHSAMMATEPPLIYWQPATLAIIHAVRQLRSEGAECLFTIDAGPSVVVLTTARDLKPVAEQLAQLDGIATITQTRISGGAHLVPDG
jgi:diphosphomevalonate decarboxylase